MLFQLKFKTQLLLYQYFFFLRPSTLFNTASSATPQTVLCVGGCWDRTQYCCDFGTPSNNTARSHPQTRPHPQYYRLGK